jgi:hypothetical protein
MLETELTDHIEKKAHAEDFHRLTVTEYKEWVRANILVEDRQMPPNQSAWLKDVKSFGIETRMRHA